MVLMYVLYKRPVLYLVPDFCAPRGKTTRESSVHLAATRINRNAFKEGGSVVW